MSRQHSSFLLAGVVPLCAAVTAQAAATISLPGIVRDFTPTHPDFEAYLGDNPGAVQTTLPGSKTPLLNGASQPTITSAASFAQWFDTVPGVNLAIPVSLTLTETSPGSGIYSYSSNDFFPIDGQGFGNYALGHNYHFTYELHSTFTYLAGQDFSFTGDDDLWVYIHNQLVIDLGGVHGPESASVNLDLLGLTSGNTYDFDLFFAERHTTGSNYSVQTSIPLVTETPTTEVPEAANLIAGLAISGLAAAGLMKRRNSRPTQAA